MKFLLCSNNPFLLLPLCLGSHIIIGETLKPECSTHEVPCTFSFNCDMSRYLLKLSKYLKQKVKCSNPNKV